MKKKFHCTKSFLNVQSNLSDLTHQGTREMYSQNMLISLFENQYLSPLKLWVRTLLRRGALYATLCDKVCQWLAAGRWFSPDIPVSSINKTDWHDITEMLLKRGVKHHNPNSIQDSNSFRVWFKRGFTVYLKLLSHNVA
jgi:hypothetical protein